MGLQGPNTTGMPDQTAEADRKYFTVEQANSALPLVERIVRDIVAQYRRVMEHHARMQSNRSADAILERVDEQRLQAADALNELVAELAEVGCDLKDWEMGLVDFPSRLEGREVCLCWKLGEAQVSHWHEVHAGFSGRRSIDTLPQPN